MISKIIRVAVNCPKRTLGTYKPTYKNIDTSSLKYVPTKSVEEYMNEYAKMFKIFDLTKQSPKSLQALREIAEAASKNTHKGPKLTGLKG